MSQLTERDPNNLDATGPVAREIPAREVLAGGLMTLGLFAFIVLATELLLHQPIKPGPRDVTPRPAKLGQPEIGIVNQELFEQDTRAEQTRQAQRQRLSTYGWVDRARGTVHVPIERAMERAVEELGP